METKKEVRKRIFVWLVIALFLNWPLVNALSISDVQATSITENSATIKWSTDESADSFVSYGDNKSDLQTIGDALSVLDHSLTLTGLLNATTYYYKLNSGDTEDNNSENLYSFQTLASGIVAATVASPPPDISASIPDTVSTNQINISGTTSADSNVTLEVNGKTVSTQETSTGDFQFDNVDLKANERNTLVIKVVDSAGVTGSETFGVYCNLQPPKIYVEKLPDRTNESTITIKGTINKIAALEILVNDRSVFKSTADTFSEDISLKEGENNITLSAVDDSGQTDQETINIYADTQLPIIKAALTKGTSYYEGRAVTDITGTTKSGAKVYLYYFKRDVYQTSPDFSRAKEAVTADKDGNFKFSDVDFEKKILNLKSLKPREIPASLKDVILQPIDALQSQQLNTYDVYLIVEDQMGRVGTSAWQQTITIYNCYSATFAFSVNPLIEFQLPYKLDPDSLDQGRQVITSVINLTYTGSGVKTDDELGFKIIGTPKIERACTPGMVDSGGFNISCKILPSSLSITSNSDGSAWFLQSTLAQTSDLSKRGDDFWNDFKDRQLTFPLKITIAYQEKGVDGKWSSTKSQVSCFDLGYFVDIPLDTKEMIPDFLADEGVSALNYTIEAIETIKPYLEKAMLVTGISCGISIVTKLLTRWYRIFMSKLEPYQDKLSSKKADEKCPLSESARKNLILESTVQGNEKWNGVALTDQTSLNKRCPSTAKAWEIEAALQKALRWTCDRFFCHEAPAEWTKDKSEGEVMTAKLKEQACGTESSQGVPLREIKDCGNYIRKNPNEFHSSVRKNDDFLKELSKSSGNTCYVDGNGFVYYIKDMNAAEIALARDRKLWKLTPIGSRGGIAVGQIPQKKDLVAYKPEGSNSFITGYDQNCADVCKQRSGYVDAGCHKVDKDGKLISSLKDGMYVAGYTKNCFPDQQNADLKVCVCQKKTTAAGKKTTEGAAFPRTANAEEEWSYRQAQLFRESGGNEGQCTGGSHGTCYPSWRYYDGRDFSAAFGANYLLDFKEEVTEVNPFTQHVGAFQTLCLSGIYNRLRLLQSVLVGIRNCLVEAKTTGITDAGQCKTIFSQAVCGLIYKLIAYAAKGCLSVPFSNVDKKGDESILGKGIGFGLGAVKETLDSTMTDLKEDYGNAQLNELFKGGSQGVIKNICLAAFGYDWPYGIDFLMDSAYRVPMKTSALIVPAERELVSYNPTKGTAMFSYRVGASIFPGCKIRSYTVKLKCIGQEDLGKENVNCPDPVYESCPCLYASGSFTEREHTLYTNVKGVDSGSYVSPPIPSPEIVDSIFRYDHVVLEINLDPNEDAARCADDQYRSGDKLTYYAPITDTTGKPLVACQADTKTGQFTCPELSNFFGTMGNTYFQTPYVQCYNSRTQTWGKCSALNNFIKGDSIKIKPLLYSDGKKQCLHITMTGMSSPRVISIPEKVGPLYTPEIDLMVVTDELLGAWGGYNIVTADSSGATCSPGKLGQVVGGSVSTGTYPFSYQQVTGTSNYEITVPTGVNVETSGYSVVNGKLQKTTGGTGVSQTELKDVIFRVGGFRINNLMVPTAGSTSGSCKYEVKATSSTSQQNVRDLNLKLELKYPTTNGDCISATQPVKSAIGLTSVSETIKIQQDLVFESAGLVSGLHNYWKSQQYAALVNQVEQITAQAKYDLNDVLAHYYGAAASLMQAEQSANSKDVYLKQAKKYADLFIARKPYYGKSVTDTTEYKKISVYLDKIKNS